MEHTAAAELLLEKGRALFSAPRTLVAFTGVQQADELLNDLVRTPHAFVMACLVIRQMKAETAALVPFRVQERLGGLEMARLCALSERDWERVMTVPSALHRFPDLMAGYLCKAVARIRDVYHGDAARIWAHKPPSAEVVYRFLEFEGVGPKIATMAANLLARDLGIEFSDYSFVDISVDVHVRRVAIRLGLVPEGASNEMILYKARALHPAYPGLLDQPMWEVGRNWCRATRPDCAACYMQAACRTGIAAQRTTEQRSNV